MPSGGTTKTYPALDLGAERGRAGLVHLNAGTIRTEVQRLATERFQPYCECIHA
jgi:hypothetical protein